jgi:integrase
MLKDECYNPITKSFLFVNSIDSFIDTQTPFINALNIAKEKLTVEKTTMSDITSVIKGVNEAAIALRIIHVSISAISRKHIKALLEYLSNSNTKFSANRYNKYRSYLMILFKELVELEACEHNPIKEISPKRTIVKTREVPTENQMISIDKFLRKNNYIFWRFLQIFYHSGARESELLRVKKQDVDLTNQHYKIIIKKGQTQYEVLKTIKDIALPYWEEIIKLAKNNEDYIFSRGLLPGAKPIRPDQITRRWKRHVKDKLNVTADCYSLKHLNSTAIVDLYDEQTAATLNSHTSTKMVSGVYDIKHSERKHDKLKKIGNKFSRLGEGFLQSLLCF